MRTGFLIIFLLFHTPVFAIQLDCTENQDGTYTCVEIKPATGGKAETPAATVGTAAAAASAVDYRKQAEALCNYVAPRKRMSGKGASAERVMEAQKTARNKYEKCLADEAEKLRKVAQ